MAVQITGWFPRLNATVAAPAMHATATLNPPTLSEVASVAISAPAMTATAVLERPVVSLNVAVAAPRMVASASMSAPTVLAGIVVAAPAMHATAALNAPTVAASRFLSVSAPAMTAAAAMATPAVTQAVGVAITATPMSAAAVLKTPTVVATTNVAVSAPPMTATAAAHVPTVSASVSITAPAMTATAAAKTPAVSVNAAITAPAMTATAAAKTPTVVASTNVSVSAPKMTATAAMNVPTVAVSVPGPTFDAVGAGSTLASGTTLSWSHTVAASTNVFALIEAFDNSTGAPLTPTSVTCGGVSMTNIGSATSGSVVNVSLWRLSGVSAGTKTISATLNASGDPIVSCGNSISFTNVTSVGTPATVVVPSLGTNSTVTQSVSCSASQAIVQGFGYRSPTSGVPFTASGGTNVFNGQLAGQLFETISHASATTTFTLGSTSDEWAGIAVVLS